MLESWEQGLVVLVRSAVQGKKETLPKNFQIEKILPLVRKQQIAPLVMTGASACGVDSSSPAMNKMLSWSGHLIALSETQIREKLKIFNAFENENIDFLLLKGAALKNYYPDPSMRTMSDLDILIRKEQYDRIRPVMKKLGYEEGIESNHELQWQKGNVQIELHKYLIPTYDQKMFGYFGTGWSRARATEKHSHQFVMGAEDEYVYIFAHFSKHYRDGGIGVLPLADLWLYQQTNSDMDEMYIFTELEKMHLEQFYVNIKETLKFWFDGGDCTPMAEHITHFILSCSAYGKPAASRNAAALRMTEEGAEFSRARWYRRLIFLPYDQMCIKYPFLHKAPVLLPAMWVVRGTTALFCHPSRIKKNMKKAAGLSKESVREYESELKSVGLQFDERNSK